MSAAPGWYPQGDGSQRYWSGSEWTEHRAPATSAAVVPAAMAPTGPYAGGVTQFVAPKNPALSLLGSFFIPGLGQLMNGDTGKGIGMFVGYVFSFLLMFVLVGFLTAPAIWIWGMIDAYQSAQRWNLQRGIVS
ncbi:DUF2510 domain-containing protein [Knoellia sp. S7-12]|uniref:DUF2510 domain-containing protein n=1 Tax=Knoellia sp. S7-12 TaxID=3126698 RepID=UPI0033662AEF